MDIKDVKDLIITIDKTSIEKVEIEKNNIKIVISKRAISEDNVSKPNIGNLESNNMSTIITDGSAQEYENKIGKAEYGNNLIDDENTFIVKSPMVGTFYRASGPDSPPFVNIGDIVQKGQTLCIIEAMKIMNEIECELAGEVVEILVNDEDTVEYGQPLMIIRR